jgi:hypothetical protein
MHACPSRRAFLRSTAAFALGATTWTWLSQRLAADGLPQATRSKVRIGRAYLGHTHPGWPNSTVDLTAEMRPLQEAFARLTPQLADVEFVDAGLVNDAASLDRARAQFADVTGILAIHLTLGTGPQIHGLLDTGKPLTVFFPPYSGHEWHTVASFQKQGKRIEAVPSSDFADLAAAIRPYRAMHHLRESRVLHLSQNQADPAYVKAIQDKFGTTILSLYPKDLKEAYDQADRTEAEADADRWIRGAEKVVEPSRDEVVKASRMYLAMRAMLAAHEASVLTMNCLGMNLVGQGMGYPCLGFVRLNNAGLGGVCEADLKSSMTHLLFSHLVGRPGFVTDPVFDVATNSIIHAHCVAATKMEGPGGPEAPYVIRSHLEDGLGVSLQVRLPTGGKVTMARLIGTDKLLYSTGDAVDSPFVERACRTKLTMRVQNIDHFLENWSSGLHRVVFYGDHTRDVRRFCRFMNIQLLDEGRDDLRQVPGLEWEPHVHA